MSELTERNRKIWSAGNWDRVADLVDMAGPLLLDAVGDVDGLRVLDVGTGSGGSVAIPAARRGARVTGLDVTDAWFEAGRRRASGAGVEVDWVAGDAMDMPLPDGSFDRVLSTFGHMFAPDHARTAAEMARVCAPDGVMAFATWRATGWPGDMFRTIGGHMPPPPAGVQSPLSWGDPDYVRGLLEPLGFSPEFAEATLWMPVTDADTLWDMPSGTTSARSSPPGTVLGDGWGALETDMRAVAERQRVCRRRARRLPGHDRPALTGRQIDARSTLCDAWPRR